MLEIGDYSYKQGRADIWNQQAVLKQIKMLGWIRLTKTSDFVITPQIQYPLNFN